MAFARITPTRLGAAELTVSPTLTTVRTTPLLVKDLIKSIDIANNAGVVARVSVYLVPSGDTAGADNIFVPNVAIPANTMFQWTGTQVVESGSTIQATASVAGVTLTTSGAEVV